MKDTAKRGPDTSDIVSTAYTKIQEVSDSKHKIINESIINLAKRSDLKFDEVNYEVPKANIQTDVLSQRNETIMQWSFTI
jgi:hypothetical protein